MNFDKRLIAMFKTKEKEHNKSIIIEVRVDEITTKSQQTYNNKILIEFNNIKKQFLEIIFKSYNDFDDVNDVVR